MYQESLRRDRDAYPLEEASERLALSAADLRQLIREGDLFSYRLGRREFVPAVELDRFIDRKLQQEAMRRRREAADG